MMGVELWEVGASGTRASWVAAVGVGSGDWLQCNMKVEDRGWVYIGRTNTSLRKAWRYRWELCQTNTGFESMRTRLSES